jgi:hypothetical protein
MNPPLVQESAVTAPEIDQPEFADILNVNEGVAAGNLGRFQHNRVRGGSPKRATSVDRMAFAIDSFKPGGAVVGCIHAEGSTRVMAEAKAHSQGEVVSKPSFRSQPQWPVWKRARLDPFSFQGTGFHHGDAGSAPAPRTIAL